LGEGVEVGLPRFPALCFLQRAAAGFRQIDRQIQPEQLCLQVTSADRGWPLNSPGTKPLVVRFEDSSRVEREKPSPPGTAPVSPTVSWAPNVVPTAPSPSDDTEASRLQPRLFLQSVHVPLFSGPRGGRTDRPRGGTSLGNAFIAPAFLHMEAFPGWQPALLLVSLSFLSRHRLVAIAPVSSGCVFCLGVSALRHRFARPLGAPRVGMPLSVSPSPRLAG
jgi:hypothetical protein